MRLKIKKTGSFKQSKKYIDLINQATVYDTAIKTPITFAKNISKKLANDVFLKREDLQPVFSFKNRGAYNKISQLSASQKKLGVIAASAGNHAQGVANASQKLKIPCLIVMPETTPEIKIQSVQSFGSKILLHGDNYNQAYKKASQIAKDKGMELIPAFDDPLTIAGQGTIGKEIESEEESFDAVFVPVGGGGLLAGVSAWIAQHSPKTKVYGVEVEDSACLLEAVKFNKRVKLREVGRSFILISVLVPALIAFSSKAIRYFGGSDTTVIIIRSLVLITGVVIMGSTILNTSESDFVESNSSIKEASIIQKDFVNNKAYGTKRYDLGNVEFSPIGLIQLAPIAILTGLYRPLIWEAGSPTLIMNGLESILFLFFTIRFLFSGRLREKMRLIRLNELLLFCFIFAVIIAFMTGLTSGLYGVLVRLRAPALPFFFLLLTLDFNTGRKLDTKSQSSL